MSRKYSRRSADCFI